MTPITVWGTSFSRIVSPTTDGSPPKRWRPAQHQAQRDGPRAAAQPPRRAQDGHDDHHGDRGQHHGEALRHPEGGARVADQPQRQDTAQQADRLPVAQQVDGQLLGQEVGGEHRGADGQQQRQA
jgi:hypothetical protein